MTLRQESTLAGRRPVSHLDAHEADTSFIRCSKCPARVPRESWISHVNVHNLDVSAGALLPLTDRHKLLADEEQCLLGFETLAAGFQAEVEHRVVASAAELAVALLRRRQASEEGAVLFDGERGEMRSETHGSMLGPSLFASDVQMERSDGGADSSKLVPKGIVAAGGGWQAKVHFENLSVATSSTRDLQAAIADLALLAGLKAEIQADSQASLGQQLHLGVRRLCAAAGKTESALSLTYWIRVKQSFWVGNRYIVTPPLKTVHAAVLAWDRLSPNVVQSCGRGGQLWHRSFSELRAKWIAFQQAFASVCEDAEIVEALNQIGSDVVLTKLARWESENDDRRREQLLKFEQKRKRVEAQNVAKTLRRERVSGKIGERR